MTTDEILTLAHREAWRYKKSSDPHHSDTYTFNRSTLLEFSRKLMDAERDRLTDAIVTACMNGDLPDACEDAADFIAKMRSNYK